MMTNIATIRPGFLVSLKTSLRGNVAYSSEIIDAEYINADGARKAKWQTERTIRDPQEHMNATKLRSQIRNLITATCVQSAFGLLCPESKGPMLDEAISQARELADRFNRQATLSRVNVYVIVGRIASDDAEAIRALNSEVRGLLENMEQGVINADAKLIRDNANKARSMGQMLSESARAEVQDAIKSARKVARKLVKAGENAAIEVDAVTLAKLKSARTSFLDYDSNESTIQPEAPICPEPEQATAPSRLPPTLGETLTPEQRDFVEQATGKKLKPILPGWPPQPKQDEFVIPRTKSRVIDYSTED